MSSDEVWTNKVIDYVLIYFCIKFHNSFNRSRSKQKVKIMSSDELIYTVRSKNTRKLKLVNKWLKMTSLKINLWFHEEPLTFMESCHCTNVLYCPKRFFWLLKCSSHYQKIVYCRTKKWFLHGIIAKRSFLFRNVGDKHKNISLVISS